MRHAGKTVTIYHKEWDKETAVDVYRGTVLDGVSFFSRLSTAVSKEGQEHTCEGVLRIPMGVMEAWGHENLVLKNGDLVCEGELQTEGLLPADLDGLCPYVFTIVGITRNTDGRGAHIKAVCK